MRRFAGGFGDVNNWWAWEIRQGGFTKENGAMATEMYGYYITGIYLDCSGLLIAPSENQ